MTLGLAFAVYLIPKPGAYDGFLLIAVALPLSGVALYRARKRQDDDGIGLALTSFAVNVVCLVIAIPVGFVLVTLYGFTVTGNHYMDVVLTLALWCITLGVALWASRSD